jgi:hypothetical protein
MRKCSATQTAISAAPSLYEALTRLSTWMPFEHAVKEMGYFCTHT